MEEILTQARFADLAAVEERGLTATVPRQEIEDAVRAAEGQPELLLDVRLTGGNGDPRVENRRVGIEWERADLDALLRQARGESVTFAIDSDSLVHALETSEVEAHGIREAAAALTVALAVAAPAAAAVGGPGADDPGIPAGFSAVEETRGVEGGTAPEGIPAGFSAVEETRGVEGGTAPEGIPAGFDRVEAVRGTGVEQPATAPGDGVSISAPELATGLGIAGAITLAIAGAAFVVRGRGKEQPA
ncbi:MAG TPA: hypothetical protein VG479_09620 [Gaiellaceae bacterium]|jgi:hypothetical protein|nr:hypothetical protein [Gaiellaceae bacterium]